METGGISSPDVAIPKALSPTAPLNGRCPKSAPDDVEVPDGSAIGGGQEVSCTGASPRPPASLEATAYTARWPPHVLLLVSCLAVAASGVGGNAARVVSQKTFTKSLFFAKYSYLMPNTLGSCLMGFAVTVLPPEPTLPLVCRSLCVGFLGSFTTFSAWVVALMSQSTAAEALEHLLLGATMPFVFFLWGGDCGRGVRWCCAYLIGCPWETWSAHPSVLRIIDTVCFFLLVLASILAPLLVQVQINKGNIVDISTDSVRTVVVAPAGAVTRFLLSIFLNKKAYLAQFPLGTLVANILGVLLAIIMLNMELTHISNEWYVVVQQGICGALSTVSSLVNEIVHFYRGGRILPAYIYALITVGVSLLIAGIGRPQNYHRSMN